MIPSVTFVWGGSVPLPPPVANGWSIIPSADDWLQLRNPDGDLFFVECVDGDYFIVARRVATEASAYLLPGDVYADTNNPLPYPSA